MRVFHECTLRNPECMPPPWQTCGNGRSRSREPDLLLPPAGTTGSEVLAGLTHTSGGSFLRDAFESLRLWILSASWFVDWPASPHADPGNDLFTKVLLNFEFTHNGRPRRLIEGKLAERDGGAHAVTRAAAGVVRPPKSGNRGNKASGGQQQHQVNPPTLFGQAVLAHVGALERVRAVRVAEASVSSGQAKERLQSVVARMWAAKKTTIRSENSDLLKFSLRIRKRKGRGGKGGNIFVCILIV